MSATGVLGGVFDPPHVGHLALAREAVQHFGLDRLLVRVVEDPGHKQVDTAPTIRLFLAELTFASIDEAEVALDRHARTVESLEALALKDPLLLLGADEFASFLAWKDPVRVLELARVGVATRPGTSREALETVLVQLPHPERVVFFPIERVDLSSSEIRRLAGAGKTIDGLVAPIVAAEIGRLGVYGSP
jgi:nicotinate-nucleotide adenylyltransferase